MDTTQKTAYYGSTVYPYQCKGAQGAIDGAMVHYVIIADIFTFKVVSEEVTYNLSDYKGDKAIPEKAPRWMLAMVDQAHMEALKCLEYSKARARAGATNEYTRFAQLLELHTPGWSILIDESRDTARSELQGYYDAWGKCQYEAECLKLGVPIIDTRPCYNNPLFAAAVISGPMLAGKPDRADVGLWGSLSYIPIAYYAAWAAHFGAVVTSVNLPDDLYDKLTVQLQILWDKQVV